jgi:hypothetical protein
VLKLRLPEEITANADIRQLWAAIDNKDVIALLDTEQEALKLSGKISDLSWLNLMLKNPYNMTIGGAGELTADLKLTGRVPKNMDFDISGSSLVLDKVRVAGGQENFQQPDW